MRVSIFNINASSSKMVIMLFTRIWGVLVNMLLIPFYIKIIGVESYGLVAFYGTLMGSLAILDLGLSASITRQVAIFKTQKGKEKNLIDLLFSVEVINWVIALAIGLAIILLAKPISSYWFISNELSVGEIEKSVILMGVIFAFQFPVSVYDGAMIGLQKQLANSVINFLFSTTKAIGAILVLKLISPTIEYYFIWQATITLLFTFSMRYYVKKQIKIKDLKTEFSIAELKRIWKFAVGMTSISLVTFFLTQIDKIVVSKMVNLDFVGYYSLAFLVAGSISMMVSPIQPVLYPKFTALLAENKHDELLALYHKSCRWVSILVFPIGFLLIFYADDILWLWTGNALLTENTSPILRICTLGTICNSLMLVPYFLTLAKGNTKFGLYQNIIASVILVPMLFWWTSQYGAIGASYVWLAVNLGIFFISLPLFHYLFLKGELLTFYKKDIALPLFAALGLVSLTKYFRSNFITDLNIFSFLMILVFISILYAFIIPEIRSIGINLFFNYKSFLRKKTNF